ncbi:hypothetical protein BZL29_8103 [Mycobacterium kansasii]|uniref:Uncharacterized protein n=1 Tax=Mycobacterium kansasii TaxID=1768 RepID=A0A1V3WCR4_MYCKA|nr:hypothetical protein BZL29_8103 [Mycobacterium kansasii]
MDLATGDTSELPAEGDDEAEAATAAPETGPVGVGGATGGVTTGGRKSAPYAGKGPAGVALTGATGAGVWPLVIIGATEVMVVSAGLIAPGPGWQPPRLRREHAAQPVRWPGLSGSPPRVR